MKKYLQVVGDAVGDVVGDALGVAVGAAIDESKYSFSKLNFLTINSSFSFQNRPW